MKTTRCAALRRRALPLKERVQNVGIRAIVASPLAISAIFNPLRKWVQASVDLCFYRRKYDASIILAAFSAKLRNETELVALNTELV